MERTVGVIEVSFELLEDVLKLDSKVKITDVFITDKTKMSNTFCVKVLVDDATIIPKTMEGYPLIMIPLRDIQKDGD